MPEYRRGGWIKDQLSKVKRARMILESCSNMSAMFALVWLVNVYCKDGKRLLRVMIYLAPR